MRPTMAAVGIVLVTSALSACQPVKPGQFVALGDSFAAGPLIPNQSLSPLGCLRSDKNYAHVAYPKVKAASLADVTCSGATTKHLYQSQDVTPGPANPPQLNIVTSQAKIVTVQMGGNDIGFSGIVKNCATENPFGSGCKKEYVHDGRDELRERIDALAPKIDKLLDDIHAKGPNAKVFLVGYPAILPDSGSGCYPIVPILGGDVSYLRGVEKYLNAMLKARAVANGDHYVDLYTPSIGHDACSGSKWVEGIIPTSAAAPVHPNATGMRNFANTVAAAINAVVKS